MAIAMVIIAQYHMEVNLFGETICKSEEEPVCPICQTKLKFRDWRRRISIKEGREVTWIMIRRLYCKKCRRLHNELPDILSPYKHYEAETIEGVVDGIVLPDDADSEMYPCAAKSYSDQCSKSGTTMPEKPHCHMIRKTRAMDLYKNGMPLAHIQQLLGHESMSTTSGFYAFATLETLARSMLSANREESKDRRKWDNEDILKKIYSL